MGWTAPPDEVPTTSSWHIDAVAGAVHPITVVQIGDSPLFLADEIPQHGVLGPKARNGSSVTIHLSVENADAALERAVAAGAEITMPIWDTPWGDRYGQFRD